MNAEPILAAGGGNGGGPSRRKKEESDDTAYELGVLSGRVGGLENSVDNMSKTVADTASEVAVLRSTLGGMQEGISKLEKTVSDEFKKLIDAQSDGLWKAFRDSIRQDALVRRGFWTLVFLILGSTAMTMSIRLFGQDAVTGGIEATRALKSTQKGIVEDYLPEGETP